MLIPANSFNTGLGIVYQHSSDEGNEGGGFFGFVGRLWRRHIRPRLGAIVGLLVGGPVGAILGELIQQGVTVLVDGQNVNRITNGYIEEEDIVNIDPDQYPIPAAEENDLLAFIENELKPTVAALANKVDAVININVQARLQSTANIPVLIKANEVLQAIATIRANNQVLLTYGEKKPHIALATYTENYVKNKTQAINLVLNALEQATIQYITNNTASVRLVEKSFLASNTTQIEAMQLRWQGKTAMATKKMYVDAATPPSPNETPVEVVTTTTTTAGTPDVIVTSPSGNSTDIKPSQPSLLKIGAIAAIAIVGYKALSSKKKK